MRKGFALPLILVLIFLLVLVTYFGLKKYGVANFVRHQPKGIDYQLPPTPLPPNNDETAEWETLSANTAEDTINGVKPATVKYSYKHPAGWVTFSGEYSYNIVVSSNKDYKVGAPTKPGEIQVYTNNNYLTNPNIPKGKEKTTLGGKPATKVVTNFFSNHEEIKTARYIAESIPTQEGSTIPAFDLNCVYYRSTDNIDLEKTCDLIASTFKFL